ncbi:SDR family oxidoreductase [Blastococcus sp. CT_GayMR19]|uniref:SDR family oxidoreductase n=1 Tax=Blastococcus sp. CT_GayMR19 TaxID=2559608 RepID=UPI002473347C|nr:SDR family oxidoreductase [Blastococcus sp. CT_GayMR19]
MVTGGSRGIGAATAVRLARAGHDVAISSRTGGTEAQRVGELADAAGARFLAVTADVTQEADVERLFAEVGEQLGPVTGLVNNAGATLHIGDLADTPVAIVRQVLDVNLLGTVLCARQAARQMSTSRGGAGGAIVNVSSAAATLGSAHEYVHYAAAKAGVDALTVGLARELGGQGIRVNAVAPGIIRTGIHADAGDPGRPDRVAGRVPAGRAGEVDEVTPAIAWLLGPEAAYVTGAVLRVSGGL